MALSLLFEINLQVCSVFGQKKTPRSGERETCGACTLLKEGTDTVLLHCAAI
jgi:hypothetical protein